jgi:hypothetical protein
MGADDGLMGGQFIRAVLHQGELRAAFAGRDGNKVLAVMRGRILQGEAGHPTWNRGLLLPTWNVEPLPGHSYVSILSRGRFNHRSDLVQRAVNLHMREELLYGGVLIDIRVVAFHVGVIANEPAHRSSRHSVAREVLLGYQP